jgi:DNA-binding NarL/FixJ family response regulator
MTKDPKAKTASVVLIEDHLMFRQWLGTMLAQEGDFTISGETDNIADGMAIIRRTKPDIAIVDVTLRGSSGLELIKNLKAEEIEVPVLVLSMHEEELFAERALQAGARGYISKHEASSTLNEAIRKVVTGEVYLGEKMTTQLLKRMSGAILTKPSGLNALADRELEVFHQIGRGLNSRQIAKHLHLGESTIETYRARIKEKLGINTSAELYATAARWASGSKHE